VDLQTAEAIDRLSDQLDGLDASLSAEIADVRTDIAALRTDVTALRTDMTALRVELHQGLDDGRRHALTLNESTRHDIRLVAEGVAALAVKIESRSRVPAGAAHFESLDRNH
jgi:hypothetical protein